jgi:uncharacterized RDD family membrane protein YckC
MTEPAPAPAGPGSVSGFGPRLLAFLVDAIAANLIVGLVSLGGWHPGQWRGWLVLAAFLAIELVFVAAAGQTPGMRVAGIAVVRVAGGQRPSPGWVLLRTLLLAAILPAVLVDPSGRAMHDRAAGTVTIRVR